MGSEKSVKNYIGKYEIIEEIGKGGMGVVYKGIDPYIERTLAIKTIRYDIPKDEGDQKKWKKRFLREAKLAGNLAHPNIVTIYDAGEESGLFYIAMEYIEGKSLREILRSTKKITFDEVQNLMEQICNALAYASKKGVIHCDIKPENIILDNEGKVYLVDFGIARTSSADLTKTMLSMVTPSYTSPERLNGLEPDIRSDIFALGAVLYEIVSGQKAFQGDTVSTIMKSILYDEPAKVETISPDMPKEVHYIIRKALAKDPEHRYQDYEEFCHDIKNYKDLKPEESFDADYNPDEMTVLLPRKKRAFTGKSIAVLSLTAIAAAGIFLFFVYRDASKGKEEYAGNGQKYIEEKNYNKAIDNLKKVIASDPTDFNAYYLIALAYYHTGQLDTSIEHYKKAIEVNPEFPPPYRGIIDAFEEKGDTDQAIFYTEQYLQRFPQADDVASMQTKLTALKERAASVEKQEKTVAPAESLATAEKESAATEQKETPEDPYEKGKTLFADKDYAQAIQYFEQALKDDPENEDVKRYLKLATHEAKKKEEIDLNRSLGIKFYEDKNYIQAAIYFKEILNLDPENKDAKRYMALIQEGIVDTRIDEITKPAAIKERPFYKRTVKALGLDPDQAVAFNKIYITTGARLEQQLQTSADEKQREEALTAFSKQTYSELRKILRPEQTVKLDSLITARKDRKAQLMGTAEEPPAEKETSASQMPAQNTGGENVVRKPAETEISTQGTSGTSEGSSEASGERAGVSTENNTITKTMTLGIQAYDEKNYDQAARYFNEVLKTDPDNAEAKKYLEYIKLAKIRMMNEQETPETNTGKESSGDAGSTDGL